MNEGYVEEYRAAFVTPEPTPVTLVCYVGDMDELIMAHATEEVIASSMDFHYKNWPRSMWPNYILMEVST